MLLLVRNVPTSLKSCDLRQVFHDAVQGNVFAGGGCFHYKHRPESESALPAAVAAHVGLSSLSSSHRCCCCIIRVIDPEEAAHFVNEYHGVPWHNKEGVEVELPNESSTIQITTNIETDDDVAALPELKPPSGLPQGNIGTTYATILDKVNQCKLPPSVLKSLAIKFRTQRKRKYSHVAPPDSYGHAHKQKGGGTPKAKKQTMTAAPHWHRRDRSVLVSEAAALAAAAEAAAGPVGGGRATGVEREDHDAEEWDRHISLNGEPGGGKERLFEEDVSQVWEKGGSGLVFHTDTSFWNQTEHDFDEKTTDDVDVDVSGYYEEGAGDQGFKDLHDLKRTGVHRPHPGLRGRRHTEDVVEDRQAAAAEFEKYTKGVGSRILGAHGWKKGEALGRPATRQTSTVQPLGCGADPQSRSKPGLGYRGSKQLPR